MGNRLQNYYLIYIEFLGYRYHGWQKQPNVKTIQSVVDKTFSFVLGHSDFKTLGASRTDARVSANRAAFELFTRDPLDESQLLDDLNFNLPSDIRVLSVEAVDRDFNILQASKNKEYLYFFSSGGKNHPFSAPFIVYMMEKLDIEKMQEGARIFEGIHHFHNYCYKPGAETVFEREIMLSEIKENDIYTASFFPEKSYVFCVHGKGFLRHQVRLMMGALFMLGKGEITPDYLRESLRKGVEIPLPFMAPQQGLMLNNISFERESGAKG